MSERDVVTVRGLRKAYGTRVVVDGLDLDVPAGEIVGLIGANGAGKTTTVECLQGLRSPNRSSSSPPSRARAVLNSSTASATRSRSGNAESWSWLPISGRSSSACVTGS